MEPWHYQLLDILENEVDDMEIYRTKLGTFWHEVAVSLRVC